MPEGERTWQEVAAANRERLIAVEHELNRVRETLHDFRAEVQAVRYLAEKVAELAGDVRRLTQRMENIARQAVRRPSATGLGLLGQWVGLAVAVVALILATRR